MRLIITLLFCSLLLPASPIAAPSAQEAWKTETSSDGSHVEARSEAGAVEVGGKLYVLGGRGGHLPVNMYDPETRRWSSLGAAPEEIHHFQPVAIGNSIYIIGALTGRHPDEPSVTSVHVLNTDTAEWSIAGVMPASRLRGSTTAVVYEGDIYISGGNTRGHSGGAVAWFDKFDPATGNWTQLADAPNKRDHASAVVIGNKLYVAGGRTTDIPNPFDKPVLPVDIYDFQSNQWSTGTDIPTARAGAMYAAVDNEMIVAGGEITGVDSALARVEAYNTITDRWRRLNDMITGRHGAGFAVIANRWHTVAGSTIRGGENTVIHESLDLTGTVTVDTDEDGLDDEDELQLHGTDPEDVDTDDDGLDDGEEIQRNTDPQVADSDEDGLNDGEEVFVHGTDPLRADTDEDGLDDEDELQLHGTDPADVDTDDDGLDDGEEIQRNTNPQVADTDEDGLNDGEEVFVHDTDPLRADTDNDGETDGNEINSGTSPIVANVTDNSTNTDADTGSGTTGDESGTGDLDTGDSDTGDSGTSDGDIDVVVDVSDISASRTNSGSGRTGFYLLIFLAAAVALRKTMRGSFNQTC